MIKEFGMTGEFFRTARLTQNMTQAELGEKLECDSQFVSNWERGLCLPPPAAIKTMVRSKMISADDFITVVADQAAKNTMLKYTRILNLKGRA